MRANRGRFPVILLVFAFVSQNEISNDKTCLGIKSKNTSSC